MPTVTVVIPCRNQAHFLGSAIRSAAQQTYPDVETIVVDDGSTDDTAGLAAAAGAVVVRQRARGVAGARNAGLRIATGKYIIFLDADDELLPNAIVSGVDILEREAELACVARRCQLMDKDGHALPTNHPVVDNDNLYRELLESNFAWTPGVMFFRRSAVQGIGGFPVHVGPASDYAVHLALARGRRVIYDPRDAVRYRQHDGSMSRDPALMLRSTLEVLRNERPFVPGGARRAFALGTRHYRAFYGDQIVDRLRRDWRAGVRSRWHLVAVWTLFRHAPGVLVTHLARKLSRVLRGLPAAALEPGRFGDIPSNQNGPESRV